MILKILQFVRIFLQIVTIFCHDLTDLTICKDLFTDCKDFLS